MSTKSTSCSFNFIIHSVSKYPPPFLPPFFVSTEFQCKQWKMIRCCVHVDVFPISHIWDFSSPSGGVHFSIGISIIRNHEMCNSCWISSNHSLDRQSLNSHQNQNGICRISPPKKHSTLHFIISLVLIRGWKCWCFEFSLDFPTFLVYIFPFWLWF